MLGSIQNAAERFAFSMNVLRMNRSPYGADGGYTVLPATSGWFDDLREPRKQREYLDYTRKPPGADSLLTFLRSGEAHPQSRQSCLLILSKM